MHCELPCQVNFNCCAIQTSTCMHRSSIYFYFLDIFSEGEGRVVGKTIYVFKKIGGLHCALDKFKFSQQSPATLDPHMVIFKMCGYMLLLLVHCSLFNGYILLLKMYEWGRSKAAWLVLHNCTGKGNKRDFLFIKHSRTLQINRNNFGH